MQDEVKLIETFSTGRVLTPYIPFLYTSDGVLVVGITDSSLKPVSLLPHQG